MMSLHPHLNHLRSGSPLPRHVSVGHGRLSDPSHRCQASMEARIAEHAAVPTPPLPVASSPLPLPSPLTTSPTDAGAPLGYRAAGIRMRAAIASPTSLLLPTSPRTD
ncbi:hypothetical protein Tco_0392217, partial [Tanacetum coccineum]